MPLATGILTEVFLVALYSGREASLKNVEAGVRPNFQSKGPSVWQISQKIGVFACEMGFYS